jgi:hypothetical protein
MKRIVPASPWILFTPMPSSTWQFSTISQTKKQNISKLVVMLDIGSCGGGGIRIMVFVVVVVMEENSIYKLSQGNNFVRIGGMSHGILVGRRQHSPFQYPWWWYSFAWGIILCGRPVAAPRPASGGYHKSANLGLFAAVAAKLCDSDST